VLNGNETNYSTMEKKHPKRRYRLACICTVVILFLSLVRTIIITGTNMESLSSLLPGDSDWKQHHWKQLVENNNDTRSENNNKNTIKYIQYSVEGGWANQVVCLKNAYELALATGRGLVLSPVVPHHRFSNRDVFESQTQTFKAKFDLEKAYKQQRPYVPLSNVLDLETSLPGLVSSVDLREFYQQQHGEKTTTIALESSVSHFNTYWIRNQTDFEGSQKQVHEKEYGFFQRYNQTFRDIVRFSETPPFRDYEVWTLLDSFKIKLHSSITKRRRNKPRIRFHESIRKAAETIRKNRWNNIPYVSVHIRGSDGKFRTSRDKAMANILDAAGDAIHEWILQNKEGGTTTVGLFVATDISGIRKNHVFQKKTTGLAKTLRDTHGIDLKLLFRESCHGWFFLDCRSLESEVSELFDRSSPVGFPGIFLDQQLAACATIDFVGTNKSTFSKLIRELRSDNLRETCAIDKG